MTAANLCREAVVSRDCLSDGPSPTAYIELSLNNLIILQLLQMLKTIKLFILAIKHNVYLMV